MGGAGLMSYCAVFVIGFVAGWVWNEVVDWALSSWLRKGAGDEDSEGV